MSVFVLVQCLGLVGLAIEIGRAQMTQARHIFRSELAIDGLGVAQFCLLGAWSGAAISVIGLTRAALAAYLDQARMRAAIFYLIGPAFVISGVWVATRPADILPICGALLSSAAFLSLEDRNRSAWFFAASAATWVAYGTIVGAWANAAGSALAGGSLLVGIWRHRPVPETLARDVGPV